MWPLILPIILCFIGHNDAEKCVPRKFDSDSIVCVCNATYCDSAEVVIPSQGMFQTYISSKSGKRFESSTGKFETEASTGMQLQLNLNQIYQTINGFGTAFTDSAGINVKKLSDATQEQLLNTYFSPNGSAYSIGRVPIGGTDFSTREYSLDDHTGDRKLAQFSLAMEDDEYKMPLMKRAREMNPELKFLAAAWSAPGWMKTNQALTGLLGFLKKEYYQVYANYLIKFLETYQNAGLPIWALSTGNEPANVFTTLIKFNDMGWLPSGMTEWVVNNLGPSIRNSTSNETIILAIDDQRYNLPWFVDSMYHHDPKIDEYMAGIAVHWYQDHLFPATLFDRTNDRYPNKFIIMTEACTGSALWESNTPILGSWYRGEQYIKSIIEDLNHWVTGWIDWNLALDKQGGPNWVKNFVDSPVIVNPETDEFFKQPMYYALAHFSKFIPPKSVRIGLENCKPPIRTVALMRPDNAIVVVLYNSGHKTEHVAINDPAQGYMNVKLDAETLMTIIYQGQ